MRLAGRPFDEHIEDARREVHRTGEHARKEEDALVLRRIPALAAPGVVLLAARAFATEHVRPGPTLAGVVDRLVHVHRDPVFRGCLDDLAIMPDHVLPGVEVALGRLVVDVAGLDRVNPKALIEREGAVELPFVVLDAHRCLVMHDQAHPFRLRISGHGGEVIVGV